MEMIVDVINERMKEHEAYQNLSLDQRGEFCVKLAELLNNYFGGENC